MMKRFFKKAMALTIAGTMLVGTAVTTQAAGLRNVFDAEGYASAYADLSAAFGNDANALYNHYITFGMAENRTMTDLIDVKKYRAAYADLDAAYGDNWDAYVNHYIYCGFAEGRNSFGKFDARAYADRYADLKAAFGYDVLALYTHWLEFGREEGRCSTTYTHVWPAAAASSSNSGNNNNTESTDAVAVSGRLVDPETGEEIANAVIRVTPADEATAARNVVLSATNGVTVTDGDADTTVTDGDADTTVTDGDAETPDTETPDTETPDTETPGTDIPVIDPADPYVTMTDENGNYTLNLAPGTYSLTATASGYLVLTMETLVVNAGEACTVPQITLLSESCDGETRVAGQLTNALNGEGISGATVTLRANWNNFDGAAVTTVTTDSNGRYSIVVDRGYYTATYEAEGFVEKSMNVVAVTNYTNYLQNEALTPAVAADSYRVVLTWGETPRDLDSHITGPNAEGDGWFHVYYGNRNYSVNGEEVVTLDHDDTSSFGPETTTIITPVDNGIYRYSVHNFSGSADQFVTSGASVAVYAGSSLVATYNVPVTGTGHVWNVFEIRDGEIVTMNQIQNVDVVNGEVYYSEDLFTE